jgi:hypothetical protein
MVNATSLQDKLHTVIRRVMEELTMPLLRPEFINSLEIRLMSQRAEKLTIAQRSILTGSNSFCNSSHMECKFIPKYFG